MDVQLLVKLILVAIFILMFVAMFLNLLYEQKQATEAPIKHEEYLKEIGYEHPKFKELTQEQIDDIHNRGMITPAEKVKEWESWDLCAPGDAIGSAAWRCRKFDNCHDCLVDYANNKEEYTSIYEIMKVSKPSINIK